MNDSSNNLPTGPATKPSHNRTRRVLVADDHEDTRLMLRTVLEMKGFSVLEADDGMKAVLLTKRELPDIVLMDFGLPVLDGLTALQLIRSHEDAAKTPVIFLSGHAEPGPKQAVSKAGCDDFLVKPVDLEKMLKLIELRLPPAVDGK